MVFHVIISFNSLVLFFYFSSIILAKCFFSFFSLKSSNKINDHQSISAEADPESCSDEESSEEEVLVADVLGGESLLFLHSRSTHIDPLLLEVELQEISTVKQVSDTAVFASESEDENEEEVEQLSLPIPKPEVTELPYHELQEISTVEQVFDTAVFISESEDENEEDVGQLSLPIPKPEVTELPYHEILLSNEVTPKGLENTWQNDDKKMSDAGIVAASDCKSSSQAKIQVKLEDGSEEIATGSFTGGSTTSDSSREWRSSINLRDSETEDPFTSSSRRSSSRWETYTVYRKYDEEMMFLDRVSAQKLTETESLRSIEVNPRSVSQRIVRKIATMNKASLPKNVRTPYQELEVAYVAQVCLAWEALNWDYKNLRRMKALAVEGDPGCPARIAQQFQQFQVLLQRFIEMEPFENGRRPEVYARMRIYSPNLLQVPEFQGNEGKEGTESKISVDKFLVIMEDAIRTFMSFLKADKESFCRIFGAYFKKNHGLVDPALVKLKRKAIKRKEMQLKDLRRSGKCFRKRRLKDDEIMEILMGLVDLKVLSRVLRMPNISEEQLHWCEDKLSKLRVWEGKLQRDSSPLFFPAH